MIDHDLENMVEFKKDSKEPIINYLKEIPLLEDLKARVL
jgi:hypothetical protein